MEGKEGLKNCSRVKETEEIWQLNGICGLDGSLESTLISQFWRLYNDL